MSQGITDAMWAAYERDGYLNLGKVLNEGDLQALQERINAIMLGTADINSDRLLMQLDSTDGKYEHAGEQSRGWKGATLNYRKIQDLEFDPLFLEFMQRPIFRDLCARVYGPQTPITAFRAMFMNKPAQQGTWLPWHQDRWNYLDRDPLLTVWTALDPATKANGCVQLVAGSHKLGLLNPDHPSGFVSPEQAAHYATPDKVIYLALEPGEVAIMHNWLLHASDVNHTDTSRRAFSVCYMDGATQASNGEVFSTIFGADALSPTTGQLTNAA